MIKETTQSILVLRLNNEFLNLLVEKKELERIRHLVRVLRSEYLDRIPPQSLKDFAITELERSMFNITIVKRIDIDTIDAEI